MDKLVDINGLQQYHNTIKNKLVPTSTTKGQVLTTDENGVKWKDVTDILPNPEYLLAYGVEWDINVADPHLTRIGNMSMHKTLPIQSKLKGCIAQGNKIMYWLDEKSWFFKEGAQTCNITLVHTQLGTNKGENGDEIWLPLSSLELDSVLEYVGKRWQLSVNGAPIIVDTRLGGMPDSVVVLIPVYGDVMLIDGAEETRLYMCGEGSRLDGYDGTVRVYCPDFYIKSESNGDKRRVWISTVKINDSWTHQPEILIDAYRSTILREVPENMGYLSTLPVNSAISVVNTSAYCRGGVNNEDKDMYLTGIDGVGETVAKNIFRTDLGKSSVMTSRTSARTYARNANSELLSYDQYKNIFYWLYVIEYANFNCQEEYAGPGVVDSNGYHVGGLGPGITNVSYQKYNLGSPVTPCGYGNMYGNNTWIVPIVLPALRDEEETTHLMPRWRGFDNPFGDIYTLLEGINIDCSQDYNGMSYVYTCQDPTKYSDTITDDYEKVGEEIYQDNYIKCFDLGNSAHIIPSSVTNNTVQYKCDYHYVGNQGNTTPRVVLVGGNGIETSKAGVGLFNSINSAAYTSTDVGFRTVSLL